MTALVLVAMSLAEARERDELQRRADAAGATLAFLQHGDPSLVRELDRLAASGVQQITLQALTIGTRSPARSWLRRVAGHWVRGGADRPVVVVEERPVTGAEAPLVSSAWEEVPGHRHHVLVCRGPRCSAQGADDVADHLDGALGAAGLGDDDVLVTQTGCLFPCNQAPVVVVHPDDAWFGGVDADVVDRIVAAHVDRGELPAERRLGREGRSRVR
jgi:(2Fe-2S) ferredoxin